MGNRKEEGVMEDRKKEEEVMEDRKEEEEVMEDRKKTGVMRRTGSTECILKWLWQASQEPGPGSWQATRALDLVPFP